MLKKGGSGDHKKNDRLLTNLFRMSNKPNMASVMLSKPFDFSKHLAHIFCFSPVKINVKLLVNCTINNKRRIEKAKDCSLDFSAGQPAKEINEYFEG